ncbi:MAG: hypothetical protein AAF582_01560 [Pseudomonadota bacterium]
MTEFHTLRTQLVEARKTTTDARTRVVRLRERIKRVTRQMEKARRGGEGSNDVARLTGEVTRLDRELLTEVSALRVAGETQLDRFGAFLQFADPISSMELLPDNTPIALFPVRLETRFKQVPLDGAVHTHLWVRIFPDDVLIDSFQPEISEAEYQNTSIYWTQLWRQGDGEASRRAAWAGLVKAHGSGRAKWLIDQITPLNLAEMPSPEGGTYHLVIRPNAPLSDQEKVVLSSYWEDIWQSGGASRDAAYATLASALGEERAAWAVANLMPVNFFDQPARDRVRLTPVVVFLDMPEMDSLPMSQEDWTRGAHCWMLPERFVLMGFREGEETLRQVGAPVPPHLQVGPDPSADPSEQLKADGDDLQVPQGMRWTVEFDDAVADGMGFVVDLTAQGIEPSFDRLFVLGLRTSSDAAEGKEELETLIAHHQATRDGLALLPQGRPTNNTEEAKAGYAWWDDPDETYKHFFEMDPAFERDDPLHRTDGAHLADLLGIDRARLRQSPFYYGKDQAEARAMNAALWPATLGYYMEEMMEPVFSESVVKETREFFTDYVLGRGVAPLIRIGDQPYGILPTTVWSRLAFWRRKEYATHASNLQLPAPSYLEGMAGVIKRASTIWQTLAARVAHVGEPGPDPQQTLLDILGLHPTSVEFYNRYSQSFTQYHNFLSFGSEPVSEPLNARAQRYVQAGLLALSTFGWTMPEGGELPEILEKIFLKDAHALGRLLVQDTDNQEAPLAVTREDGRNYVDWLGWAGRQGHSVLREQAGFADDRAPGALLYRLLHHALDLGYVNTGFDVRRAALDFTYAQYRAEKREPKALHILTEQSQESRWAHLYQADEAITGVTGLTLGNYIPTLIASQNLYLNRQLAALDVLKDASVASLERALVEHIDCLSYRLDAWRGGLQAVHLAQMRATSTTDEGNRAGGLYVGAYGWVENLRPSDGQTSLAPLDPPLAEKLGVDPNNPLLRDPENFGHIHAPSLDQAVTAAILRNGHLANRTPDQPDLLAVDLSSAQARVARQVIEGIRNGQSLGALLGYRLERALHDEPSLFLDRVIYDLRRAFPLVGNRNRLTRVEDVEDIRQVEARNVVDGLAFAEHIEETGSDTYPYGLSLLPPLGDLVGPGTPNGTGIGVIIDAHVAEMRSIGDAVADTAIAEGVYQMVRGNYDRAAGAMDAVSKGGHAEMPEVTATPRSGQTLTHRLAVHLEAGLDPWAPRFASPREKGEPALAAFLPGQTPDPSTIFARISWYDPFAEIERSRTPSMADLGLTATDLFYVIGSDGERDLPGFDALLIDHAEQTARSEIRDDVLYSIELKPDLDAGVTVFEVAPLFRALAASLLGARAVQPTDLLLQNEASRGQNVDVTFRNEKVRAVIDQLQSAMGPLTTFVTTLDSAIGEGVDAGPATDAAVANIDQWMLDYADGLRPLVPFGKEAPALTAGVEGRRSILTALRTSLSETMVRWQKKSSDFAAVMADYSALPLSATEADRQQRLIRAGRLISTDIIAPLPATLTDLETELAALKAAFDTAFATLNALHANAQRIGETLQEFLAFLPDYRSVDHTPLDLSAPQQSVLALARDLLDKASRVRGDLETRLDTADIALTDLMDQSGRKAQATYEAAARALLGESFLILPEFAMGMAGQSEWAQAWGERSALLDHLRAPDAPSFPVEDWLQGMAKVRDRPRHIEMAAMMGEIFEVLGTLTLEPLQFPYRPHDVWLGQAFPDQFRDGTPFALEEEKLLYTAHYEPGAVPDAGAPGKLYCGVVIDDWVEVIPRREETTGVAFHYNRPNTEAPQTILLVTPPAERGNWVWQDVVDTLHETLDQAQTRAVEPDQLDKTALGPLLPAILSVVTAAPITAALNFSMMNPRFTATMEMLDE